MADNANPKIQTKCIKHYHNRGTSTNPEWELQGENIEKRWWRFKQTCGAMPEQYDIIALDGTVVGYIRLRFGLLTATICTAGGTAGGHEFNVYTHTFKTDISEFADDKQRKKYLKKIASKLNAIMDT